MALCVVVVMYKYIANTLLSASCKELRWTSFAHIIVDTAFEWFNEIIATIVLGHITHTQTHKQLGAADKWTRASEPRALMTSAHNQPLNARAAKNNNRHTVLETINSANPLDVRALDITAHFMRRSLCRDCFARTRGLIRYAQ